MIFTCLVFIINLILSIVSVEAKKQVKWYPRNFIIVETLAEEYPFVVALLNNDKEYQCTGTIINKDTVLTSGSCIFPKPKFVLVGAAVIGKSAKTDGNLFKVTETILHRDYQFDMKEFEPKATTIHSNLGLVIVKPPRLDYFIEPVDLDTRYATELKNKNLVVLGYGKINGTYPLVLQTQIYIESPCINLKWFYCICGTEYTNPNVQDIEDEFGNGGPVIYEDTIVAVSAAPCRFLSLPRVDFVYNVFTIVGPYVSWIRKPKNVTMRPPLRLVSANKSSPINKMNAKTVLITLIIGKIVWVMVSVDIYIT